MGKSDIANFAAKYALYGRVELDGALYVEVDHKNRVSGLIKSICNRLSEKILMPAKQGQYKKEDIIGIINHFKYLIIIDNVKALIQNDKEKFNRFLSNLIDRT
jgi:hypothetical protein